MRHLRTLIIWCLLIAWAMAAVGCNTIEGMGKDIQQAGEAIQKAFD